MKNIKFNLCYSRMNNESMNISIAALFEIFVACILYWFYLPTSPWLLMFSAIFIPLLLMKSKESIKFGVVLFDEYWNKNAKLDEISLGEIVFYGISLFIFSFQMSFIFLGFFSANLFGNWFLSDGFLLSGSVVFFISVIKGPLDYGINLKYKSQIIFVITFIGFSSPVFIFDWNINIVFYLIRIFIGLLILKYLIVKYKPQSSSNNNYLNARNFDGIFVVLYTPFLLLGIVIRSIIIRIFATAKYLVIGFECIPKNWWEMSMQQDITYSSELLPGAGKISKYMSCDGLFNFDLKRGLSDEYTKTTITVHFIGLLTFKVISLVYRLSLKSTIWLWLPLIFVSIKKFLFPKKYTINDIRLYLFWTTKSIIMPIAICLLFVVFYIYKNNVNSPLLELIDIEGINLEKLRRILFEFDVDRVKIKNLSLTWWFLLLFGVLLPILYVISNSFQALFGVAISRMFAKLDRMPNDENFDKWLRIYLLSINLSLYVLVNFVIWFLINYLFPDVNFGKLN